MSVASLAPQRGYPQGFVLGGDVPDTGLACGMPMREGAGGRIATARGIIEYLPELPDASGRASRYVIHLFPRSAAGGALAIDQAGTIREGLFPGVAPTLEAIQAGNLDVCDALADFECDHSEPRAAQRWWDHACERGRLMSCMFSSRYSPRVDTFEAQRDKERCKSGEPRYCERLQRAEIEAMRKSGGRQVSYGPGEMTPPAGKTQ